MIRIGTRKSKLALMQTDIVKAKILELFPEEEIEIVPVITRGDVELDKSLASFGGKGVFTQEIEEQLCAGTIDIAVHSAKDMPMELAEGLDLGAVIEREDCRDVLVTVTGILAKDMPAGSVVGTSSLRRELQIKAMNPNITTKSLRGNVPTRLNKLREGQYDGIILAAAGLKRLRLLNEPDLSYEYFNIDEFLPAAGQGILALEIRKGSLETVMEQLNDANIHNVLKAERQFLSDLGGSCNAPCGIYCYPTAEGYGMKGMYAKDGINLKYMQGEIKGRSEEVLIDLAHKLAKQALHQARHSVSLVGAGPGNKEMMSQKALACIQKADVIIYDNLISPSILNEARMDAELLYVGKRAHLHAVKQEEINERLVEKALEGKYVVRLKGGDPFIFGRGGEEALYLRDAGISFEIVSGISSAYSVPAWAGIPVTHRGVATSFHVITGHEKNDKDATAVDYQFLAKEKGTLVFLMGLNHLREIAHKLIAGGKSVHTPAAVIQSGCTARQRTATGRLIEIADIVEKEGLQTPAIIVIGEVVALQEKLEWLQDQPLSGKKILLTGTRHYIKELEEKLESMGAETIAISLIETQAIQKDESDALLKDISNYNWVTFVSVAGVDAFFNSLDRLKIDRRKLAALQFAVVGKSTAEQLWHYGYQYDFMPTQYASEVMAKEWISSLKIEEGQSANKVLVVRGTSGMSTLENELKQAGIYRDTAYLYETVCDERRKEEINRIFSDIDYTIIASGLAGRTLSKMLSLPTDAYTGNKIVAIGEETEKICKEAGILVDLVAQKHTAEGIVEIICQDVKRK